MPREPEILPHHVRELARVGDLAHWRVVDTGSPRPVQRAVARALRRLNAELGWDGTLASGGFFGRHLLRGQTATVILAKGHPLTVAAVAAWDWDHAPVVLRAVWVAPEVRGLGLMTLHLPGLVDTLAPAPDGVVVSAPVNPWLVRVLDRCATRWAPSDPRPWIPPRVALVASAAPSPGTGWGQGPESGHPEHGSVSWT